MPRPRFQKLEESRRNSILVAAAIAFSEDGYFGASMNQILENAGLSKGAAYYYFDDKADLFATTIEYCFEQFHFPVTSGIEELNAENFWETIELIYREPFLQTFDRPYLFGVIRSAFGLTDIDEIDERLAPIIHDAVGWLDDIIGKGQEYGLIRTDVPVELLNDFVMAIDFANDSYLSQHQQSLDQAAVSRILHITVDMLRRMLTP